MSYISGKERTFLGLDRGEGFGGFSGIEEGDLASVVCTEFPGACAKVEQGKAAVEAARKKAAAELVAVAGQYGPILAGALDGATNPLNVAKKAQQLAASFSADGVTRAAYQLFYSQSHSAMDLVDAATTMYPGAKFIFDLTKEGKGVYGKAAALYNKVSGSEGIGAIDAGGVADGLDVVRRVGMVASRIGNAFGSEAMGDVAAEVAEWAGVAAGCATMIGAGSAAGPWGTAAGAVGCAASVLLKVFGLIGKPKPQKPDYDLYPRAAFSPQPDQGPAIAADAARLAALLRYRYSIPSYGTLHVKLAAWNLLGKAVTDENAWPPPGSTQKPPPALSPFEVLLALGYTAGYPHYQGIWWWGAIPSTGCLGKILFAQESESYRSQMLRDCINGDFNPAAAYAGLSWAQAYPGDKYSNPLRVVLGRYLELVRFFGAITLYERDTNPQGLATAWQTTCPVRLLSQGYSDTLWTGLPGAFKQTTAALLNGVDSGDVHALEDLGHVRLVAAFSYMHMAYHWGKPLTGLKLGSDLIAELPVLSGSDPASALRIPFNPRADAPAHKGILPTTMQLYGELRARNEDLGKVFAVARAQAFKNRQVEVSQAMQRTLLMQKIGAGGGIESPGALKAKIQALEKAGTVFTHTPTTTPTDWIEPAGESGGGGVILAAVAGLAALLLLRK